MPPIIQAERVDVFIPDDLQAVLNHAEVTPATNLFYKKGIESGERVVDHLADMRLKIFDRNAALSVFSSAYRNLPLDGPVNGSSVLRFKTEVREKPATIWHRRVIEAIFRR